MTFEEFDIHCGDAIEMWDGSSEDSPKMASFCGNGSVIPPYLLTSQNHLKIRYILQNLLEGGAKEKQMGTIYNVLTL